MTLTWGAEYFSKTAVDVLVMLAVMSRPCSVDRRRAIDAALTPYVQSQNEESAW
jgi:hypothetical protein